MKIKTRLFSSLISSAIGAGVGSAIGRMSGGFFTKSEEQIRAEHPEWTKDEVKNEYRRLVHKARRHSAAYGFALGSRNGILTTAALGGAAGRIFIEPEQKYINKIRANDPAITRREAELMYEKEKDNKEAVGALIGGFGGLLHRHYLNEKQRREDLKNKNKQPEKKRKWF